MRFLVSAYGCEPNKGSEPGVGWQWSLQLARFGEVWVITRSNNRENIEAGLASLPDELVRRMHFVYHDAGKAIRRIKKGERNLYPYYFAWQAGAVRKAGEICREVRFDYCFALTFGSLWMPTFLYRLKIPFIWGPIGGGEAVPDEYLALFDKKAAMIQRMRKTLIRTAGMNPFVRKPAGRAEYIITRTDDTKVVLTRLVKEQKVVTCSETAIDPKEITPKTDYSEKETIRFIYSGRLIRLKGIRLMIRALAKTENRERIHLTIAGDGPELKELEKLAEEEKVSGQITFAGRKERKELLEMLRESDVYIFPSLKEGGSWSLMEAMGTGLPVICLDTSGMHVTTDEKCAIRIGIDSIEHTTEALAEAMDRLAASRELREEMGKNARERILTQYNWDAKGQFIRELLKL